MAKMLNSTAEEEYLKACVYGRSGTGKTTLSVTAPKPLIILSERQGYRSVRDAAKRLGVPVPPTVWVETLDDLRTIIRVLQMDQEHPIPNILKRLFVPRPVREPTDEQKAERAQAIERVKQQIAELPYYKPETVVPDSMTDIFKLIAEDIESTAGRKVGKDGLETKPERFWGVLRDRSERLIRQMRDLPYHVLFLALLDDRTVGEGEEQSRVVGPACAMRALPDEMVAATNLCGIMSVKEKPIKNENGEGVRYEYKHWVRFAAPGFMRTKPLRPLRDVEVPHFGAWLERLSGDTAEPEPLDLGDYDPLADPSVNQPDDTQESAPEGGGDDGEQATSGDDGDDEEHETQGDDGEPNEEAETSGDDGEGEEAGPDGDQSNESSDDTKGKGKSKRGRRRRSRARS